MRSKLLVVAILLSGANLVVNQQPASAQEDTNPQGYDQSFVNRPDHKKPPNPFALKGSDFHKHSYRRMLLNSPFASSSVGLGANATNKVYNQDAYTYLNPESFKANDVTPEELNRYIDHAYAPKVGKGAYNPRYHNTRDFEEQENPFSAQEQSQLQKNPYGDAFDLPNANANNQQPQRQQSNAFLPSQSKYNSLNQNAFQKPLPGYQHESSMPSLNYNNSLPNNIDTSQSNF